MNTTRDTRLTEQLAEMEHRWKLVQFAKSGGYALLLLLGALAVAALLDYLFFLSMLQRRLLSVACYGTVISYAWFGWLRPFWRPLGPRALAWILEDAVPEFNEKLISAVEFAGDEDNRTSLELIHHVLEEAEIDLLKITPRRVFPLGKQHFLVPALALTAFIVSLCIPHLKAARLIKRVVYPSVHDATVGRFDLTIMKPVPGPRAEGDTVSFVVRCTDPSVRDVKLCIMDHRVKRYRMRFDEKTGLFMYALHGVRRSMHYWAVSGGVSSSKYYMRVDRRPKIESFTVHYRFPEYTGLPDSSATSTSGDLRAYRNSVATLEIKATVPLERMTVKGTGCRENEEDVWQRVLPLDDRETTGLFRIRLEKNGSYSVILRDRAGLENLNPLVYSVVALDDKAPNVTIDHPISDLYLDPGGTAALSWTAEDDFGIDHVELHYTVNGAGEKFITLDTGTSTYNWPMRAVQCGRGDEIAYFVRVYDASGHSADSDARRISIVGTRRLRDAGHFVASARNLHAHLSSIRPRLEAARRVYENIRSARNHPQRVLEDTITHNLKVMREHHVRLAREIGIAEGAAGVLSSYGFFPRSRFYSDMMGRYFRQERLFFSDDDLDSLGQMLNLTAAMTEELIDKAGDQVPRIQLDGIVLASTSRTTPGTRAILIRQADDIARARNTIFANDFKSLSRRQTHGLRGQYYRESASAAFSRGKSDTKPSFTRLDHSILFPNSESFGAGDPPFSAFWSGLLSVRAAGTYTFFLSLDGAANLFVDGVRLIAADRDRGKPREQSGKVALQPGFHTIHLQYSNSRGNGSLALHWAIPGGGKVLLTKPALLTDHPKAFHARLRALANFIETRARDYGELERLAAAIRKNIRSTETRILDVARELELYNRETDWNTVMGLSEAMAETAANSANELDEAKQHRDLTVVGEVLERAVVEKDVHPLRAAAKVMPEFERLAEVRRLNTMVESAAYAVRIQAPGIRRSLSDKRRPSVAPRELDRALEELRAAHEFALGVATFSPGPHSKEIAKALQRAELSLTGIRSSLAHGEAKATEDRLNDVMSAVKTTEKALSTMMAETGAARETAHDTLAPFTVRTPERLGLLWDELGMLPARLRDSEVAPADMASASRDVDNLADGLAAVADRLRIRARAGLQPPGPDIGAAAGYLAMASALDAARTGPLTEAARILNDPPGTPSDCPVAAADAAEHLEQALNTIGTARSLAARSQADKDGDLSAVERQEYRKDLALLMERYLPPDVRSAARAFIQLEAALDSVRTLAHDAARLKSQPNPKKARDLSQNADRLRRDIDGMLDLEPGGATNTPPRPPKPEPEQIGLHLLDTVTRLNSLVARAEAAAETAARLRNEIHPDQLQAIRLLDEIPVDDLAPALRTALSVARRRVSDESFAEKARQLQLIARQLGDRDPGLKQRLATMADQLNADHAKETRIAALESNIAGMEREIAAVTGKLKLPATGGQATRSSVRQALAAMTDNVARRDFTAARRNLATVERDLWEPPPPTETTEAPRPEALADEGVRLLDTALRHAAADTKDDLAQALAAATTGELERAAVMARDVAAAHTNETRILRALTDASAFEDNTVEPLRKAVAEARANRFARARLYVHSSDAGNELIAPLETARKELRQAASGLLAEAHESENRQSSAQLAAAARAAFAGDLNAALNSARKAGKEGLPHVRALQKAGTSAANAVETLERAAATASKAAVLRTQAQAGLIMTAEHLKKEEQAAQERADKDTAAALAARRAVAEKAMGYLKKGDFARSEAAVRELAGGAMEAAAAARKFETALREKPKAALRRAEARAEAEELHGQLAAFFKSDGAPTAELIAAASKAITAAQAELAAGSVNDATIDALKDAAVAIEEASGSLVHTVLTRHSGAQAAGASNGTGTPGNGAGNVNVPEIPVPSTVGIADPWAGVSGSLSGGDKTRLKTEYGDYYRKAIQKYFERISKRR